jgi:hypothetical protein
MRYLITFPTLCLALLALSACSSESDQADTGKEHVWKDQVEAIDKAREVETILKRKQDQEQQQ